MALEAINTPSGKGGATESWARLLARMIDYVLVLGLFWLVVVGISIVLMVINSDASLALLDMMIAGGFLMVVLYTAVLMGVWFIYDAILLSTWGRTPGKWFMRLRVRTNADEKLTFQQSCSRAILVLTLGMGLGIPLVGLIAAVTSYNKLEEDRATTWDKMLKLKVQRDPVELWRTIVGIIIWIGSKMMIVAMIVSG